MAEPLFVTEKDFSVRAFEVIREFEDRAYLFLRVGVSGPYFPQRDAYPFVRIVSEVGTVESLMAEISTDQKELRGLFPSDVRVAGRVECGYASQVVGSVTIREVKVARLDPDRIDVEVRRITLRDLGPFESMWQSRQRNLSSGRVAGTTEQRTSTLRVDVREVKGNPITGARIVLRHKGDPKIEVELRFDERLGLYTAGEVPVGGALLRVEHDRFAGQEREIRIEHGPNDQLFILGEPGVRTYFREKVRVPVDADTDLIGVTIRREARSRTDDVDAVGRELGLDVEHVPELAARAGVRLYRTRGTATADALARLSEHPLVEHAGAVVAMRENGFSHLTQEIVVRFRLPSVNQARSIAQEYEYSLVRELVYSSNTYVLRWRQPATLDILDSIDRIAARDDVEWAEPSLVVTPEVDAIIPSDPLWPGLWDRQLIGCQDAWQALQDAGLDTFGDPNILLAVWDSGVQSSMGAPTNLDFQGTLSNGAPKIFTAFDMDSMVANNDAPWSDHGSGVAGVCSAKANDASPIPGEFHGLVGSAPNVQIMTIVGRMPYIDIEVGDQYIWMAGFDPASPIAGFPVPLLRGADVITCSLTPGAGAPLSGTARATLDFVTTFGRGGKGTMCFFSTGNANQNNVTARPYGAYEKCFGIAGTSIDNDGVTEIRAPFSGWGQIALCSPTQDAVGTVHNPPAGYMPWGAAHAGQGNLISYRQLTTALTAASAAGTTTLTVASIAGLAANQVIHVGPFGGPGSEPARITAVNPALNELTVQGYMGGWGGGLLNPHAAGTVVATGPANHRNDFGGTSSATPLCAGVAALVLSANPDLTYIEAREVMRNSAVKFDLANTDPVGQWLDAMGNPSAVSGLPPVKSGWYGYGRVNANGAVQGALTLAATRDLVIRDNLADTGTVSSAGAFWNSPDIWCRRLAPAMDPGALPASYANAGPHEDPIRGQSNYLYARVRNIGTTASLDAWVRLSITHFPGAEFTWPASFQPTNGPGDPIALPMAPGTYFIGEAKITGLAPGADQIVNVEWPAGLIPPETVMVGGMTVHWHPCLLVEITPHDGPAATGVHVWDDNNLGQKNITILDTDAGGDFAMAIVIGHEDDISDYLILEVDRGRLPRDVQLYVDLVDPILRRRLRKYAGEPLVTFERYQRAEDGVGMRYSADVSTAVATLPMLERRLRLGAATSLALESRRRGWKLGNYGGREVVFLNAQGRPQVPVYGGPGSLSTIVVGGIAGPRAAPGEYEIVLLQREPSGRVTGSAVIALTIGRK